MAFSIINVRTPTPLSFPLSNRPKSTFHLSPSPSINIRHSNCRITISAASPAKTVADVQLQDSSKSFNSMSTESWSEFAKNVSGEWDGHGADFTIQGQPIELPETVVPEAYREWEVKVFDWQTQCPTLAQPEEPVVLYKLIKLLPTVGCEADAATRYTIDEKNIGGADNKVSAFAYQSTGCYVAVWPTVEKNQSQSLELEHCLVDPRNKESRVRIVQIAGVDNSKMVLKGIQVFCEQWYGPFTNGEQLGGCSLRDSAFASTEALNASQITGVWQGSSSVATFQTSQSNILQELLDDNMRKSERNEENLILLPKQLWCSLKEGEGGETCSEAGWLLDDGRAITSRCIFSNDTKLKEVALACETRAFNSS